MYLSLGWIRLRRASNAELGAFFAVSLDKLLNKQSRHPWFEMQWLFRCGYNINSNKKQWFLCYWSKQSPHPTLNWSLEWDALRRRPNAVEYYNVSIKHIWISDKSTGIYSQWLYRSMWSTAMHMKIRDPLMKSTDTPPSAELQGLIKGYDGRIAVQPAITDSQHDSTEYILVYFSRNAFESIRNRHISRKKWVNAEIDITTKKIATQVVFWRNIHVQKYMQKRS